MAVTPGRVTSIIATTVPVKTRKLRGKHRVSRTRARAIARRAVAGREHALPARPIAYAGSPAKSRAPRRAYVVQLTPDRARQPDQGDVAEPHVNILQYLYRRKAGSAPLIAPLDCRIFATGIGSQ